METAGLVLESNWSSCNAPMPFQTSELMPHFQDNEFSSISWPSDNCSDSFYCSLENANSSNNLQYFWSNEDDSSSNSNLLATYAGYGNYYSNEANEASEFNENLPSLNYNIEGQYNNRTLELISNSLIRNPSCMNETSLDGFGDSSMSLSAPLNPVPQFTSKYQDLDCDNAPFKIPKKRSRASVKIPKTARTSQSKRAKKIASIGDDEEIGAATNGQNSCSYNSEDDSQNSQDRNGGNDSIVSSKVSPSEEIIGKTRAGRGMATDTQSLYARKRRERINERLKVLQHLVPNGTKVDISTMLEEAAQYVKFLQLQIKLLSSDELWMYAPLADNGMNIGLNL